MPRSVVLNINHNNERYPQQLTASSLPNDDINAIKKGGKNKNKKVYKIQSTFGFHFK